MAEQDAVFIEPQAKVEAAVILMHGLGADGHDFEALVPELSLPALPPVRWIFPNAPVRPVTINRGYAMRAWYDVVAIDRAVPEDEAGIRDSAQVIGTFIQAEYERGIPASRILLAGFSQGGAMALFTALRWPERLAGLVGLSCYLPLAEKLAAEAHPANSNLPVFIAHGTLDPIVPFFLGETARDILRAQGHEVVWRDYRMQHEVCQQEVADLREWLLRVFLRRATG
jgi:phospholipase/carboxylesterase